MIKSAKEIACAGVTVALLIGGQYSLSMISGIEVVTAIFAVYCLVFGVLNGVVVGTAFSLVRCFIFGFFPQVIVLYLIYYNLFALIVGLLAKVIKQSRTYLKIIILTAVCIALTITFTVIDNALNVFVFGLSLSAVKIYFLQSVPVLIRQVICVGVTVPLFFFPLQKIFLLAKSKD